MLVQGVTSLESHEKAFQNRAKPGYSSFSDQSSPLADLEHPFALSLSIEKT